MRFACRRCDLAVFVAIRNSQDEKRSSWRMEGRLCQARRKVSCARSRPTSSFPTSRARYMQIWLLYCWNNALNAWLSPPRACSTTCTSNAPLASFSRAGSSSEPPCIAENIRFISPNFQPLPKGDREGRPYKDTDQNDGRLDFVVFVRATLAVALLIEVATPVKYFYLQWRICTPKPCITYTWQGYNYEVEYSTDYPLAFSQLFRYACTQQMLWGSVFVEGAASYYASR